MRWFLVCVLSVVCGGAASIETLVDSNRLEEARRQLRELIATDGHSPRTKLIEAMILYREGSYLPSMQILSEMLGPEQRNPDIYKLFGLNLVAVHREVDAEPFFRAAASLAPEDVMAQYYLGLSKLSLRRYEEAESLMREVIRLKPAYIPARTMFGFALEQQQKMDAAIEAYKTAASAAVALKEPAVDPEFHLGRLLLTLSRTGEALEVLQRLTAAAPEHAEAHRLLGRALLDTSKLEDALQTLSKAVELDPKNRQARYALAQTLQRLGRREEAELQFSIIRKVAAERSGTR